MLEVNQMVLLTQVSFYRVLSDLLPVFRELWDHVGPLQRSWGWKMLGERKVGETRHKTPNLLQSLTWYVLNCIEKVKIYSLHSRKYIHVSHCLTAIMLLVFINFMCNLFQSNYQSNLFQSNLLIEHFLF